ncbi:beta-lactamase family protein [Aspergillus nomiae NRRL 13137]|uniref:Beta-lactamase family protein n=1 Tax=Aspergillus nomiae NRRL (strain ATCC 15546 / NRRL 13137 / CBS 260.88 / M93) TaxID=1509407 RepID=A0A0L1IMS6_ASPN3|nr:beta-lactamase family protein [Aspergillus nomiae NRRL 13137]KNG80916.1 beta-lactamase family protein [Aspergillus nomiae NRRL 13137]
MSEVNPTNIEALKRRMQSVCSDSDKGLPGVSVAVVGRDGKQLFSHAAGKRGRDSAEPMAVDSVFWIASCTKMITGIACMQLVEQGKLSLDDADQIHRICPEFNDLRVLQEDGTLVERNKGISLRMLLTHTSGFGYTFYNEKLRDYGRPVGYDEFSGYAEDFNQPLVHQPGEAWEYSIGIDWAGVVLERVTGQSLNDYFHQHIFEPLGLKHISMIPTEEMKAKLAYMHQRAADGQLSVRDHLLRRAMTVKSESDIKSYFNSGGAGCFSTAEDYSQILAVLLNNGTSPRTGKQLLKKETVDEMFRNQIENLPPLSEKHFPDAKADLSHSSIGIHPTVEGDRQAGDLPSC